MDYRRHFPQIALELQENLFIICFPVDLLVLPIFQKQLDSGILRYLNISFVFSLIFMLGQCSHHCGSMTSLDKKSPRILAKKKRTLSSLFCVADLRARMFTRLLWCDTAIIHNFLIIHGRRNFHQTSFSKFNFQAVGTESGIPMAILEYRDYWNTGDINQTQRKYNKQCQF